MATEVIKRLLNVEEYYKMAEAGILKPEDRVELIHGEIYEMSPIGSKHGSTVKRLNQLLNRIFNTQVIIGVQDPVRLNDNNEPEPDLSILKYQLDFYAGSHPTPKDVIAIIEVADSSLNHDMEVKKPLYASFAIPEYWVIDIDAELVQVFKNPAGNDYLNRKTYHKGDSVQFLEKAIYINDIFPS